MQFLLNKRRKEAKKQAIHILTTILRGGGAPFFFGFLLITSALVFHSLLTSIPDAFPIIEILSILLIFLLNQGQIRTWLQPADITFLLPLGGQMKRYFKRCFIYSLWFSLGKWVILCILLFPFYQNQLGTSNQYLFLCLLLFLLQVVHLVYHWYLRKIALLSLLPIFQWLMRVGFLLVSFLLLLSHFYDQPWFSLLLFIIHLISITWLHQATKTLPIPWIQLIQQEQQTYESYLRIASWFVDLPQITYSEPPRNRWLAKAILSFIPQQGPYLFLYTRSFLRTQDIWSTYWLLQVWALLILFAFPNPWVAVVILGISLGLMAVQLPALGELNRYPLWPQLYPISKQNSRRSLSHLSMALLCVQSIIIGLIITWMGILSLTTLVVLLPGAWIFSFLISYLSHPFDKKSPSFS